MKAKVTGLFIWLAYTSGCVGAANGSNSDADVFAGNRIQCLYTEKHGVSANVYNATVAYKDVPSSGDVQNEWEAFRLGQVRLLPSPFLHAQQLDAKWLLSLEPDRLLHRFHKNAGLQPKGENYGGWEQHRGGGRGLGHYMSACAMMWASTGNPEFKQRTDYVVNELEKCQKAS